MLQLIYGSSASAPFSEAALTLLLDKARARNQLYDVTGLLLYHSGAFLQVLEGPRTGVNRIFDSISRDTRHGNTKVLARREATAREFGDWSMSFENTSNYPASIPGLVDYHRSLPALTLSPTDAKKYLRMFQDGLFRQR